MRPDLVCFASLVVSDPRLEDGASTSTYTFTMLDGAEHSFELRYKYDAPLYRDANDVMRDHARVHHAIASLNYGLFTREIRYEYPLTEADLAYLREMEDVTAREQYLTRFVRDEPHPLILPAYHVPPAEFEPEAVRALAPLVPSSIVAEPKGAPQVDRDAYMVLSSGGKESLLTYGLLRELGKTVTPVYVNESGRHWHTAVTSYRHHLAHEPRTRRIWTTVDRLYVGVNRLLPFVRPDFQRVRADVYPIQLFTFNSYQVAVAGLALHEGTGTLLMGNEFDEGPWPEVKGVRHYFGIYDQSQEFDGRLTKYYADKGWGLRQTSLMRPLTSLVIEDLLASRYQDLLVTQTSCHATNVRDGLVRPCGRCSKCLGVLMFLIANGHDQRALRYEQDDIDKLGARLAATEIKVDRAEAEHSLFLATKRGWKFEGSKNGFEPTAHPEVEAIRFHPEMSHRDAVPSVIADEIYRIYATRAKGMLEFRDGAWRATQA